jgi:CheY-like chemotaxis protein
MSEGYDATDVSMPDLLLVEDNPLHVRLVRSMLEEIWFGVGRLVHVTRVQAALDHLAGHLPECILLDLHLPDAEGLVGLDRIRAVAPDVPVVVLSAHEDNETAVTAIRRGAQDYLVKGDVPAEGIARAIRFAIERTRRHRPAGVPSRGALAVLDAAGTIVMADSGFVEMTGRPVDDVVGAHLAGLWDGDAGESIAGALGALTRAGGGWTSINAALVHPDGATLLTEAVVSRLAGGDADEGGFVVRVLQRAAVMPAPPPVLAAPPA